MDNPVTYYGLGQNGTINVTTTTGKNLFNEELILGSIKDVTYEDGHYVFRVGQAYAKYKDGIPSLKFKDNTQYTMTIKGYSYGADNNGNNGLTNFRIVFKYTDGTEEPCFVSTRIEATAKLTTAQNKTIEKMYMYYGYGGNAYISHIQLEEGTTATPYEPYKGRTTTIDMTGHAPLMCLGDNCDYIDYENKRIVRNVGKYIVTGNENWSLRNSDTENNVYTYSIITASMVSEYKSYENTKALNNYLEYSGTVDAATGMYSSDKKFALYYKESLQNSRAIYINSTISTKADFKSNLQSLYNNGNPMIIYYELAQPTYESITLPQLSKYYDDYNIFAHDEYGITEVTY